MKEPIMITFFKLEGVPQDKIKESCERYLDYATQCQHRKDLTDEEKRRTLENAEWAMAWVTIRESQELAP